jgi:hypothetical protein
VFTGEIALLSDHEGDIPWATDITYGEDEEEEDHDAERHSVACTPFCTCRGTSPLPAVGPTVITSEIALLSDHEGDFVRAIEITDEDRSPPPQKKKKKNEDHDAEVVRHSVACTPFGTFRGTSHLPTVGPTQRPHQDDDGDRTHPVAPWCMLVQESAKMQNLRIHRAALNTQDSFGILSNHLDRQQCLLAIEGRHSRVSSCVSCWRYGVVEHCAGTQYWYCGICARFRIEVGEAEASYFQTTRDAETVPASERTRKGDDGDRTHPVAHWCMLVQDSAKMQNLRIHRASLNTRDSFGILSNRLDYREYRLATEGMHIRVSCCVSCWRFGVVEHCAGTQYWYCCECARLCIEVVETEASYFQTNGENETAPATEEAPMTDPTPQTGVSASAMSQ